MNYVVEGSNMGNNEEPRIEPYYQAQAKQLTDSLFDLGLLSESMSRDGVDNVEGLVALYFQQIATSAAKTAGFTKRYKVLAGRLKKDDDDERKRHEEEMRWIERCKTAEREVLLWKGLHQKLQEENKHVDEVDARPAQVLRHGCSQDLVLDLAAKNLTDKWILDVGGLLDRIICKAMLPESLKHHARNLLERGMDEGVLPAEWTVPTEHDFSQGKFKPGAIHQVSNVGEPEPGICPRCGKPHRCESMHSWARCQKPEGHNGCHEHRSSGHIEQW
jgi:hypothetical protein